MTTFVGAYEATAAGRLSGPVALGGGVTEAAVWRLGSLAVAGTAAPERRGSITCVVTGELHNRVDLTTSLAMEPTAANSAVVAVGCAQRGIRFLRELRGAYHVALWDEARQEAIIGRDHLSACAVFYCRQGRAVFFAADIAPLLRALPRRPAPNREAIPRWITDRSLPGDVTLYEGVRRLGTGCVLKIRDSTCEVERIWEPAYIAPHQLTRDEAEGELRRGVSLATRRRLTTDGTTGILLSGGFDSATLAGTASRLLQEHGRTLPAYSTVFPGEPWDESPDVRVLVAANTLPSTQLQVRGGTLLTALRFQRHWNLPQPAPGSILDTPLLTRAFQDGLRVVLDGQGGDELFTASPYLLTDWVMTGRLSAAWRLAHRFPNTGQRLARWQARALLQHIVLAGAVPYRAHRLLLAGRGSEYEDLKWLRPAGRRAAEAMDDAWSWKQRSGVPRWWAYLADLLVDARELAGLQDYLRRRGAMVGIDSRQPLLTDVDLVELVLRLPPEFAFSPRYDRALAREAMQGVVPEPIRIPTRKSSYGELMRQTLTGPDFPELQRILERPDAEVGAFVDLPRMRDAFLQQPPGPSDPAWTRWGHHIWSLATTELWLREEAMGSRFQGWADALALRPTEVETIALPAGSQSEAQPR